MLVTHDMDEAIHLGDRIAVMDEGKLLQYATPDEIVGHAGDATSSANCWAAASGHSGCCRCRRSAMSSSRARPRASRSPPTPTLRDALAEALWTGRDGGAGRRLRPAVIGRRDAGHALVRQAARPQMRDRAARPARGAGAAAGVPPVAAELSRASFEPLTKNGQPAIYTQNSLLNLTLSHLGIVAVATLAASLVAVGLAILVTRPFGAEFLPLSRTLANIGQTFPPVAVLALAVPALGFGTAPTLVALFLYGLLPIFENALTGLTDLPPAVDGGGARHRDDRAAAAVAGWNCRWRCR